MMKKIFLITALCLSLTVSSAYARGGFGGGGHSGGGHSGGYSGGHSGGSYFGGHSGGGYSRGYNSGFSSGSHYNSSSGSTSYHSGGYSGGRTTSYSGSSQYHGSSTGSGHYPSSGHVRTYGMAPYGGSYRGHYAPGRYYGGHYYPGGYYGRYPRHYYRGYAPYGAAFGFFFGGVVIGGAYNPFWWPYYYVPVSPAYYDPYYSFPYTAPAYVISVPPAESTTAYSPESTPSAVPPNQCYAPKVNQDGSTYMENGSPVPDFSRPVPCPPNK